ncbi:MAG: hypothetical protein AAGJ85_07495 [Pseudomonadota bacterium]
MKRMFVIAALALAACNPTVDSSQGAFETIDEAVLQDVACVFRPADGTEGVFFATYADNPDFLAVARYKNETIKLVPREVPVFDGDTFDITYEVIDYLKWQVRAEAVDGEGGLTLIQDGTATDITADMIGSCGA